VHEHDDAERAQVHDEYDLMPEGRELRMRGGGRQLPGAAAAARPKLLVLAESGQCPSMPEVQSCGSIISVDGGPACVGLCGAIDSHTTFARNMACN
jgi:hypothetical protein